MLHGSTEKLKFYIRLHVILNTVLIVLSFSKKNSQQTRAGGGISEPVSDILYNMLPDELFKHPATQIESLVLYCR